MRGRRCSGWIGRLRVHTLPTLSLVTTVPRATGSQKLGVGLGASLSLLSPQLAASSLGNSSSQPPFPSLRCPHTLAGPGPQALSSCAHPPLPAKRHAPASAPQPDLPRQAAGTVREPTARRLPGQQDDASPALLPPGQGQPLSRGLRRCRIYSLSAQPAHSLGGRADLEQYLSRFGCYWFWENAHLKIEIKML